MLYFSFKRRTSFDSELVNLVERWLVTRLTGGEMTVIRWHDIHLYTSLLSHNVQSGLNSHDKLKLANSCAHQCGV